MFHEHDDEASIHSHITVIIAVIIVMLMHGLVNNYVSHVKLKTKRRPSNANKLMYDTI